MNRSRDKFLSFSALVLLSGIVVAFGHSGEPLAFPVLSPIAFGMGYGLFWKAFQQQENGFCFSRYHRFFFSLIWFMGIQSIALSWFPQHVIADFACTAAFVFILLITGVQFALFSLLLPIRKAPSYAYSIFLASVWVLFEYSRLFLLAGLSWNPMGMALATFSWGAQLASVGGVYLLSFWSCLTNLIAWKALSRQKNWMHSSRWIWIICLLFPYIFGAIRIHQITKKEIASHAEKNTFSLLLIDTSLSPKEKGVFLESKGIPPYKIWKELIDTVRFYSSDQIDLILLPEGFAPYPFDRPLYSLHEVEAMLRTESIPLPEHSLVALWKEQDLSFATIPSQIREVTSDAYFAQALSSWLQTDVMIGGEEENENRGRLFTPREASVLYYAKRVLVPMGEYIPSFPHSLPGGREINREIRDLSARYGIVASFTPGKENPSFPTKVPSSLSICYEETVGYLLHRQKSCSLLLNMTNDNWWEPNSSLGRQHLAHARLRPVENGCFHARACNQGISTLIDPMGRSVQPRSVYSSPSSFLRAIHYSFTPYTISTPYVLWGDFSLLIFCAAVVFLFALSPFRSCKLE